MATAMTQQFYVFHDLRHIRCGDLEWRSRDGKRVPLIQPAPPPVRLHSRPVCMPHGVRLVAQKASKIGPLPPRVRLGHVVFEEGRYRSWHLDVTYPPGKDWGCYSNVAPLSARICAVQSENGMDWSEPVGSPISLGELTGVDGFTVFRDPSAPSAERYKGIYMAIPPRREFAALWEQYQRVNPCYRDTRLGPDYMTCLYGAVSPDGLRWTAIRRPLMIHKSDTDTTAYYDADLRRYVMYTRLYRQERRWIARAESDDFRHWEGVVPLLWPGSEEPLTDDLYTNCRTTYPGLPDHHLMFPMVYHRKDQTSEVRMHSSSDGLCWTAVPGGPVVSPGGPGEWDEKFIHVGNDLVPWAGDRVALAYLGSRYPHKYPRWPHVLAGNRRGWVCWPKGRLCAVTADGEGEFHTPPLTAAGRALRLNLRTRKGGWVRAAVIPARGRSHDSTDVASARRDGHARETGRALEDCAPVSGDGLALPVHWRGRSDINVPAGAQVSLHFSMRKAELFGFEWLDGC